MSKQVLECIFEEYRVSHQVLVQNECIFPSKSLLQGVPTSLDLIFKGYPNKSWGQIVFHFVLRKFTTVCSNKFGAFSLVYRVSQQVLDLFLQGIPTSFGTKLCFILYLESLLQGDPTSFGSVFTGCPNKFWNVYLKNTGCPNKFWHVNLRNTGCSNKFWNIYVGIQGDPTSFGTK